MRRSLALATLTLLLASSTARAQFSGPGGGMRPMGPSGMAPGGGPDPKKEEGPAEAAPETRGQEVAIQPLGAWTAQREKTLQFLQINGYMRGRAFYMHKFNLGIPNGTTGPSAPFWTPYSETQVAGAQYNGSCAARDKTDCKNQDFTSADMRLRIEPTINVTEQVRVKAQIDVFDNLVLGSTPEGYSLGGSSMSFFSRGQVTPEAGVNSFENAIRVKRAWSEVKLPIGELRFGRMPSHWGAGMLVNNGDCLDCNYGTNVDRVMFMARGWNHFVALMWDWAATGPTTRLYTPTDTRTWAQDADGLDDVQQWTLAIGRQDKPEDIKERVDRGEVVFNYGGHFMFRRQTWDQQPTVSGATDWDPTRSTSLAQLSANLAPRDAWALVPDIWLRLNWRKLQLETELAVVGGRVNQIADQVANAKEGWTLLQYGGVFRGHLKLLRDALHIQLEIGYASGDAYEDPTGKVNYRQARIPYPDGARLGRFSFDPDYHVDLILFRRILGTVSNATYFKPTVQYDLNDYLSGRVDVIYSLANNPVAYPGNAINMGIEIDAAIMYRNDEEGFYAGIMYGVLFPLGALSVPGDIYGVKWDAETAQTVQARVVVKF